MIRWTPGAGRRARGLILPPLLLCLVDFTLTLAGQSPRYWAGEYHVVNEISPVLADLLRHHTLAFAVGGLVWVAVFGGLILLLPELPAAVLSIAVTFGHTAGACTWLLWRFQFGYQACNALVLLSALVLGIGVRSAFTLRQPEPTAGPIVGVPTATRFTLIALLAAAAAFVFLIPQATP